MGTVSLFKSRRSVLVADLPEIPEWSGVTRPFNDPGPPPKCPYSKAGPCFSERYPNLTTCLFGFSHKPPLGLPTQVSTTSQATTRQWWSQWTIGGWNDGANWR